MLRSVVVVRAADLFVDQLICLALFRASAFILLGYAVDL